VLHIVVLTPQATLTANLSGTVSIGASAAANVQIADAGLADVHCRIDERPEGHVLVREALPLLVNGQRLRVHLLVPGDMIVMGSVAVSVRAGHAPAIEAPQATLARLAELRAALGRGEPAPQIAERLVRDVVRLARGSQGALIRFAAADEPMQITSFSTAGMTAAEGIFSRNILARMVREERPIFISDTLQDVELANAKSLVATGPLAVLALPVIVRERIVGALYVSAHSIPGLLPDAAELAESYAHEAAAILDAFATQTRLENRLEILGDRQADDDDSQLKGKSQQMVELRSLVRRIARNAAPVLVRGETGTGKEVVARELHRLSPHASGPFVALNCGAISESLLASELFGHVRGAFTGAVSDRLGAFRSAEGGTLFLDEIGDMPLAQQVSLLRALQERVVTPVGSERAIAVDTRIVLATHRDLENEVKEGRFRQDLYYRVAMLLVDVPPLRQRGHDIVELAEHFLRVHAPGKAWSFSPAAIRLLLRSQFSGNVRELDAAMMRVALMVDGTHVDEVHLAAFAQGPEVYAQPGATDAKIQPLSIVRDAFLRAHVRQVVDQLDGNRGRAAEALMVSSRTVFKYMDE
jgi:DNA-binding NtrC family response regulator